MLHKNMVSKSNYPFPELLPLLRLDHSASSYLRAADWWSEKAVERKKAKREYMDILPTYTYARCPLCNQTCSEIINTYSLPLTQLTFGAYGPFSRNYPQGRSVPCQHYIGTHSFLHLHENLPTEMTKIVSIMFGEVPYVTPWLLVNEPDSYVVVHALPICRIKDNTFIPTYTHFILTYFSEHPSQLIDQVYASQAHNVDEIFKYFLADRGNVERYDLQRWATQGKLGYLDYTITGLPLKIGKDLKLPDIYQNILGRRYRFFWNPKTGNLF